jgi:hypothetical protein
MSPDGTEVMVKNYYNVYYFPRNKITQTMIQVLQQTPTVVDAYVGGGYYYNATASLRLQTSHPNAEPQGEGIAYDYEGVDLYTNSEYNTSFGSSATRYPQFRYQRLSRAPTTIVFQDGVSPSGDYAGTVDTYVDSTLANVNTAYGTATTFIVDTNTGGLETNQRWGLLKFDISAIPSNATVVGAKLDLYDDTEGQGFVFYRMTSAWDETSTWTSLNGAVTMPAIVAGIPEEGRNGVNLDTIQKINVRTNMNVATVQGWVNGTNPNYGWLIKCTDAGGDGTQFVSREGATASQRPKLTVRYILQ